MGMDIHCTHLSHKQQRRLRKKLKRQYIRRKNAQLREANSRPEEITEEEAARIRAEEELEKQRHDEEERQWLERERVAQEIFAQKALEEAEKRRRLLEEAAEIQKEKGAETESQANGTIKCDFLQRLRDGVEEISDNLPPYHRPEPPVDYSFAPPIEPALNTKELCGFFWKTGACIYGDRCSRFHPIPPIDSADLKALQSSFYPPCLVLVLENMFDNFSLRYDPLEVDESQLQSDYELFYEDVRPELEVTCGGVSALRCCRNAADHLRGNVYVQLTGGTAMAIEAATRLNGRWYAGRQITTRLAYLGGGWKAAVCGLYLRDLCPKGDRRCNFLHLFLNPHESSGDLLAALCRGLAELPSRKEKKRASHERCRDKDSEGHRRKRRRSTLSHSDSRRRYRHQHKKHHHKRKRGGRRSRSGSRSSTSS